MSSRTILLLVISVFVLLFVGTESTTCPANGILCYPSDCCAQFQQCLGSTFWAPQNTPAGTVCKAGQIVWPTDCTTPCSQSAPPSVTTSTSPTSSTSSTSAKSATSPSTSSTSPSTASKSATSTSTASKSATSTSTASTSAKSATSSSATTNAPTTTKAPSTSSSSSSSTSSSSSISGSTSGSAASESGTCNLAQIFSEADFNTLFPNANGGAINGVANQHAIFNYSNIIAAAAYYPTFGCTGDVATRKRELAAFLGQTSQETSGWWSGQPYNWGYYFSTEVGCTDAICTMYCDPYDTQYPCASGQAYYGRGPVQLSYNYNYGQASQAIFQNDLLLTDPDQLLMSGVTAFRTSLWFWMTEQTPKPSCHEVITGLWTPSAADTAAGRVPGYGMVTNVINGGVECDYPSPQSVINRVQYFTVYAAQFGTTTGDNLYCNTMQAY